MIDEAVILSYLEWIRLIERGWIKLDRSRLVRYASDREDHTDLVFDLMRNAPDVGVSSTDFILTTMRPVVLDKLRAPFCVAGERLALNTKAMEFHSFTENALAVHEHDARTRNIPISLASRAFCGAWQVWSMALDDIAADIRSQALSSKFHLPVAGDYHLVETMKQLTVDNEKIAKSQDTMCFGWAYVLNGLKNIVGSITLPQVVKNEMLALQREFGTDRPFLSRAPKLKDYFRTWSEAPDSLPVCLGPIGQADFLAIATLKHYERCNIKSEGRDFNYRCFQDDVREIAQINNSAAAFLVYQMGARLPDWIVASLQALPAEEAGSRDHVETVTISGAELTLRPDNPIAKHTPTANAEGDAYRAPAAPDGNGRTRGAPANNPPATCGDTAGSGRQRGKGHRAVGPATSGGEARGGNEQLNMLSDNETSGETAPRRKRRPKS